MSEVETITDLLDTYGNEGADADVAALLSVVGARLHRTQEMTMPMPGAEGWRVAEEVNATALLGELRAPDVLIRYRESHRLPSLPAAVRAAHDITSLRLPLSKVPELIERLQQVVAENEGEEERAAERLSAYLAIDS